MNISKHPKGMKSISPGVARNELPWVNSSHCRSRFILFLFALLSTKYMPIKPRPVSDFGLDLKRLVKNSRGLMSRESRGNFIVDLAAVVLTGMLAQTRFQETAF